jgi:hypothetical protein
MPNPQLASGRPHLLKPSLLTLVAGFSLFITLSNFVTITDINDLYWHVRMGQDIIDNHRLTGDPSWVFGPVGDSAWVTTQAVSETLMYFWWRLFGWNGFASLRLLLGIAFLMALWWSNRSVIPEGLRRIGRDRALLVVGSLFMFMVAGVVQERPQTVTFIMMGPLSIVLYRLLISGRWPNPLLVFGVVMVWSWFHGGAVLVGPLIASVFAVRLFFLHVFHIELPTAGFGNEGKWRWLLVFAASMIAPLFNPIGINLYLQARKIQTASVGYISEWNPIEVNDLIFTCFLVLACIWIAITMTRLYRRQEPWRIAALEGTWIATLLVIGLTSMRVFVIVVILLLPVVTRRLAQVWNPHPSRFAKYVKFRNNKVILIVLLLLITLPVIGLMISNKGYPYGSPLKIISGLAKQDTPEGRYAFIAWNVNGQFQAMGGTHLHTYIDGRTDRYGPEVIKDYVKIKNGNSGWEELWNKYPNITDAVLEEQDSLIPQLQKDGWRVACVDEGHVWLVKKGLGGTCGTNRPATTGVN